MGLYPQLRTLLRVKGAGLRTLSLWHSYCRTTIAPMDPPTLCNPASLVRAVLTHTCLRQVTNDVPATVCGFHQQTRCRRFVMAGTNQASRGNQLAPRR